jgi:nitroimidazol reductase NimA-like FMN-containing flavoprotein (pyridoxamine 5'-phosphate oxidase superfamily)
MAKYHMNKKEKEITDNNEIVRILKNEKYAVIAMCSENEPYIVTLSYGYCEAHNCLYFHSALKGLKIDFINKNPKVCATVIEDKGYQKDNCEHHYSSVVMWGNMSPITDLEEKKHALDVLLTHLEENPEPIKARNIKNDEMYNRFALLKLEITELTGKSGS